MLCYFSHLTCVVVLLSYSYFHVHAYKHKYPNTYQRSHSINKCHGSTNGQSNKQRSTTMVFYATENGPDTNNTCSNIFNELKTWSTNNISWPNIISGVFLGGIVALTAIFLPFFISLDFDENNFLLNNNQQSIIMPIPGSGSNNNNNNNNNKNNPNTLNQAQFNRNQLQAIEKSTEVFQDILLDLKNGYVDEVNPNTLFETAMSAMLKSLDPYTEYENLKDAKNIQESVSGKYGGVGMVISGMQDLSKNKLEKLKSIVPSSSSSTQTPKINSNDKSSDNISNSNNNNNNNNNDAAKNERDKMILSKLEDRGIVVVDAFEGYAYDNNIRVGDRIVSVDGKETKDMTVDNVRNLLRGEPGTNIDIVLEREGVFSDSKRAGSTGTGTGDETLKGKSLINVSVKRQEVKVSDVALATYLGAPQHGIGYIALTGFNADAAHDFASALLMLKYSAPFGLQGLIVDLRGNPGGLLDAAIDIASYLVPPNSPIVSAKTKNDPEVVFQSTYDPIRPPGMKLAVLVNSGSASASEIVSGAVQDLDAGVIVGDGRTYGKGLVQKIIPLPYQSSLKFTVAKYYTPSGRCIQAVNYLGGRSVSSNSVTDGSSISSTSQPEKSNQRDSIDDKKKINGGDDNDEKAVPTTNTKDITQRQQSQQLDSNNNNNQLATTSLTASTVTTTATARNSGAGGRIVDMEMNEDVKKMLIKQGLESGDGATLVESSDRKEYHTRNGRVVLDGGGITPDVKVDGFNLSPAESVLISQNAYTDFATHYLQQFHTLRPLFHNIIANERQYKETDPRFDFRVAQSVISRFFVLPTAFTYNPQDPFHNSGSSASNSGSISNINNNIASKNGNMQSPTDGTSTTSTSSPSKSLSTLSLSTFLQSTSSPLALPLTTTSDSGSFIPKLAFSSSSASSNTDSDSSTVTASSTSKGSDRHTPLFDTTNILATTGTTDNENTNTRKKSASPPVSWEKELLTLSQTKQSTHINNDRIFKDFKSFVQQKSNTNELNLDIGTSSEKLNELMTEFKQKGFDNLAKEVSVIKNQIAQNVLSDIDKHRSFIYDSIELTLLSRELPDRLLLYRAVVSDPQVEVARNVLLGSSGGSIGNTKNDRYTTTSSNTSGEKKGAKDNDSSGKGIIFDSSNINEVNGATISASQLKPQQQPYTRLVDGSKIKDFRGVYEQLLSSPTQPSVMVNIPEL